MPRIPFASMPAAARLWVFGTSQPVLGRDAEQLLAEVELFMREWHAHGQPVVGACDWRYDHFLAIAADEAATGVSGCSIDSLYHFLKRVEHAIGVTILDASPVWFRDGSNAVRSLSRSAFRELVMLEEVDDETIVFDNTVGTVGGFRDGEWERPLRESWHGRAFRIRTTGKTERRESEGRRGGDPLTPDP